MKKIPMILLILAPYGVLATFDNIEGDYFVAAFVLHVIVLLLNVIYAFLLRRLGYESRQILFWNMMLKLCHIPLYVLIFIWAAMMFIIVIPLIPVLFIFDYILMLTTSMYGFSGMIACHRKGQMSTTALIINTVAHLIFCTDVISAIYLYIKSRKTGGEHD